MRKILAIAAFSFCTLALAAPSMAQHSRGGAAVSGGATVRGGGATVRGGAVAAPRVVTPGYRGYYRPYYYPRYSFGFYAGYPYYSPYYYPYGYYGYGYGYPYAYGGYGLTADEARGIGGVKIKDAPKHAQVFADGYYAGNVDDFDGAFQRLDLEAGSHTIEIRPEGGQPTSFEVNIHPGETVTYHAH